MLEGPKAVPSACCFVRDLCSPHMARGRRRCLACEFRICNVCDLQMRGNVCREGNGTKRPCAAQRTATHRIEGLAPVRRWSEWETAETGGRLINHICSGTSPHCTARDLATSAPGPEPHLNRDPATSAPGPNHICSGDASNAVSVERALAQLSVHGLRGRRFVHDEQHSHPIVALLSPGARYLQHTMQKSTCNTQLATCDV
jgi:hypothetical protein